MISEALVKSVAYKDEKLEIQLKDGRLVCRVVHVSRDSGYEMFVIDAVCRPVR